MCKHAGHASPASTTSKLGIAFISEAEADGLGASQRRPAAGQEVTQYTYFQQAAGLPLPVPSVEITYGLERIMTALQVWQPCARPFPDRLAALLLCHAVFCEINPRSAPLLRCRLLFGVILGGMLTSKSIHL